MRKQTKKWTTADDRRIRICDMTDSHLRNTIDMLEKNSCCGFVGFGEGEMFYDDYYPEIYYNMLKDLERREWESGARRRALDESKRSIIQN